MLSEGRRDSLTTRTVRLPSLSGPTDSDLVQAWTARPGRPKGMMTDANGIQW